ncbi:hypothetical protein GF402_11005 [Candidatus Fermentibacteria bacterium]|nr:hypothetical protein [Candidatus Fermentibacteria bacterium]
MGRRRSLSGIGLLVKTHAFGDSLLATPAATELVRRGGRWWALCGPSAAAVWERLPGLERVLVAPFPFRGPAGLLRLGLWSLGKRKDLRAVERSVVFAESGFTRRWVRFLTGSVMRSGGSEPLGEWERCVGFDPWAFAGRTYADIAGVDPSQYRPIFPLRAEEESFAAKRLPSGRPWVAVAPGGACNPRDTVPQKRWPPERFAALVDRLFETGFSVVLLGGRGDVGISASVSNRSSCDPLDLTGTTDWGRTAAVISRCRGFLGVDTGTAHLAVAVGVRPVLLFGPTNPDSLYDPRAIVAVGTDAECAPCYSNSVFPGCSRRRGDCMERISVDQVWSALKEELDENSGS